VRSAVSLDVSHAGDDGCVWVSNTGLYRHVVSDIEITAVPDNKDWEFYGPLPHIYADSGPGVTLKAPIKGGWFNAYVTQLAVAAAGLVVAAARSSNDGAVPG
jgi:hypothetical protein